VNQKAEINAKDKDDWTPLHYAAQQGHLSVVEYLVNQKANINPTNKYNQTPLGVAMQNGKSNVVEFLKRNEEEQRLRDEAKRKQRDCRI